MRNRLDRKKGRFSVDYETDEIHEALAGWQSVNGTTVLYYRFDAANSVMNDIYDEAAGTGKAYKAPFNLPVLHATHTEGGNENRDTGFYFNDELRLIASFDQVRRTGLTRLDVETQNFLNDRVVYDNRVFRITRIEVLGQIQNRDIIVAIDATQVKPDELVDDFQFGDYSDGRNHPGSRTMGDLNIPWSTPRTWQELA